MTTSETSAGAERSRLALRRVATSSTWRVPLVAWATSRALVLLFAIAGSLVLGVPARGVDAAVPKPLALLGGWDTTWYLMLARHGYEHDHGQVGHIFTNLAFFPLLSWIMAVGDAVGLNPFAFALVVSNLTFLVALLAFHRLTTGRLGSALADRATWVLAFAPPSVAASQAYTEGVTLALAICVALAAYRRKYALAGAAAGVAALARPTGVLVAVLVALLAWRDSRPGRARRLALALGPAAFAIAGLLLWMQLARGSWSLPFEAQLAWKRGALVTGLATHGPQEVGDGWHDLIHWQVSPAWSSTARDLAFSVLYAWLLVRLWRSEGGLRSPWVGYSVLALALPLSSGSIVSMARFGLIAFPLAWPLAEWLGRDTSRSRRALGGAIVVMALLVMQLAIRSP